MSPAINKDNFDDCPNYFYYNFFLYLTTNFASQCAVSCHMFPRADINAPGAIQPHKILTCSCFHTVLAHCEITKILSV